MSASPCYWGAEACKHGHAPHCPVVEYGVEPWGGRTTDLDDLMVMRWPDGEVDATVIGGRPTTPWSWATLPGFFPEDGKAWTCAEWNGQWSYSLWAFGRLASPWLRTQRTVEP